MGESSAQTISRRRVGILAERVGVEAAGADEEEGEEDEEDEEDEEVVVVVVVTGRFLA